MSPCLMTSSQLNLAFGRNISSKYIKLTKQGVYEGLELNYFIVFAI